jgi:uncharacterized membrane protein
LPVTNAAGDVVVGRSYRRAVIWAGATGQYSPLRDRLEDVLSDDWELFGATGVSDDGRTVVGYGSSFEAPDSAWVGTLGPTCAPDARIEEASVPAVANSACGGAASPCDLCPSYRSMGLLEGHAEGAPTALSADGRVAVGWGATSSSAPIQAVRWRLDTGSVEALTPDPYSTATGVSGDGRVVTGYVNVSDVQTNAVVWSDPGGAIVVADNAMAVGVSGDGATVAGMTVVEGGASRAFTWTAATGLTFLALPDLTLASRALAISADGRVVVGSVFVDGSGWVPMAWTPEGTTPLGSLGGSGTGEARSVSADGTVIVGQSSSPRGLAWFRWTAQEGMVRLGLATHDDAAPWMEKIEVDATGTVVVGNGYGRAFAWEPQRDRAGSVRGLLGERAPNDWVLLTAVGVADEGRIIVGRGRSPDHEIEGWIANFKRCEPDLTGRSEGP